MIGCFTCFGQVTEDFSDGDFTSSPEWHGTVHSFTVNSGQLQLNERGAGIAYLSTSSGAINDAIWEFEVELDFNPSAQNLCRVYLYADGPDLSAELKGYYVQVGGSRDKISLYRQDLTRHVEIINGFDGMVDTSSVRVVIRVTREATGKWELSAKHLHHDQYQLIGQVDDEHHIRAGFFGYYCRYTSTRSQGFFLDNIYVTGTAIPDNESPGVSMLNILNKQQLLLVFDEPVQSPLAEQFRIAELGMPSRLWLTGYNSWVLTFELAFEHGQGYVLEIFKLKDLSGNIISTSASFEFWETGSAITHDVIITEIMADPAPTLQLPDKEYLEIYNRSDSAINLMNWSLSDASKTTLLPDFLVAPGRFVVLCPGNNQASFPDSVDILALTSWTALNNLEDHITLFDSTGQVIHHVNYDQTWYRNNLKKHGGWSLEMIDINYPCSGATNWTASSSASGGTPGNTNSVSKDNPDLSPPVILSTLAPEPMLIHIDFDQSLSEVRNHFPEINITPFVPIDTFYTAGLAKPRLIVKLADSLDPKIIYNLSVRRIADCNGNINFDKSSETLVGLAQTPDSNDLVINEIMFNPRPLGVRYVEIYNRSSKALNLKNWRFARWQARSLDDFTFLSSTDLMIYPGEYRVFTENVHKLLGQHPDTPLASMIPVKDLPLMPDKEGSMVLVKPDGGIVDALHYHQDMHHPLLTDRNGVSLERASANMATSDPSNWYSSAEISGYATPGASNSQLIVDSSLTSFRIEPRLIAPLSVRLPGYARIYYHLDKSGSTGSVHIYNQQGYEVRTLVNNSLLSTNGSIQWDGTDQQGHPVPLGYYIVLLQLTQADGMTSRYLETIVVAPNF
jgi:hypothetical protein